jgi:hypothetical protein
MEERIKERKKQTKKQTKDEKGNQRERKQIKGWKRGIGNSNLKNKSLDNYLYTKLSLFIKFSLMKSLRRQSMMKESKQMHILQTTN